MVHALARADEVQSKSVGVFGGHLGQQFLHDELLGLDFVSKLAVGDDDDIHSLAGMMSLHRRAQGLRDQGAAARRVAPHRRLHTVHGLHLPGVGDMVIVKEQIIPHPGGAAWLKMAVATLATWPSRNASPIEPLRSSSTVRVMSGLLTAGMSRRKFRATCAIGSPRGPGTIW